MDSPGFLFENKKDRDSRTKLIPTEAILASPAPIRHLQKLGGLPPSFQKDGIRFEPNITFFSVLAQEEIPSKFYQARSGTH